MCVTLDNKHYKSGGHHYALHCLDLLSPFTASSWCLPALPQGDFLPSMLPRLLAAMAVLLDEEGGDRQPEVMEQVRLELASSAYLLISCQWQCSLSNLAGSRKNIVRKMGSG